MLYAIVLILISKINGCANIGAQITLKGEIVLFYSFDKSQEAVRERVRKSGEIINLMEREQLHADDALRWGVTMVDNLLSTFLHRSFPDMEVAWGIEIDSQPNASVWGGSKPSVVLLTSGAIKTIYENRTRLAKPLETFASDYAFLASRVPEGSTDTRAQAIAQTGNEIGLFALAALFAHEVGHVHDCQFENVPIRKTERLAQAHEITADTWAIRACTQLAFGWASDIAKRLNVSLELPLRSTLYYMLVGHGTVDNIDWSEEWVENKSTHPPGALRLVSAAVTASEWITYHKWLDEDLATKIASDAFSKAAQTLHWLNTGKEMPPEIFMLLTVFLWGHGGMINNLREEYEGFRRKLLNQP